jgi:hypothetical protein
MVHAPMSAMRDDERPLAVSSEFMSAGRVPQAARS